MVVFSCGGEVETFTVPLASARETNDGALARDWAVGGYGITMKSVSDIAADLRAGRLNILMPEWRSPDVPVHALYQRSRCMAPRVRALLDFLAERFLTASRELEVFLNSGAPE
jgi:DNA-binding transcriptional LysR family regulator